MVHAQRNEPCNVYVPYLNLKRQSTCTSVLLIFRSDKTVNVFKSPKSFPEVFHFYGNLYFSFQNVSTEKCQQKRTK